MTSTLPKSLFDPLCPADCQDKKLPIAKTDLASYGNAAGQVNRLAVFMNGMLRASDPGFKLDVCNLPDLTQLIQDAIGTLGISDDQSVAQNSNSVNNPITVTVTPSAPLSPDGQVNHLFGVTLDPVKLLASLCATYAAMPVFPHDRAYSVYGYDVSTGDCRLVSLSNLDVLEIVQDLTVGANVIAHPFNSDKLQITAENAVTGAQLALRVVARTASDFTIFVPVAQTGVRIMVDA
jgi:hypothetical protein